MEAISPDRVRLTADEGQALGEDCLRRALAEGISVAALIRQASQQERLMPVGCYQRGMRQQVCEQRAASIFTF